MSTQFRDKKTGRFTDSPAKRNQSLVNELYRAFDFFNEAFAENKLPKCIITIQNKGQRQACGWFSYGMWSDNITDKGVPEINISAEYGAAGTTSILETLLHEMAHYWNAFHNIDDCSSNQYHNKKFKSAAERFGLKVTKMGYRGWAWTSLEQPAKDAIKELAPDEDSFQSLRRRSPHTLKANKYTHLVVLSEVGDNVKHYAHANGLSVREVTEAALDNYLGLH